MKFFFDIFLLGIAVVAGDGELSEVDELLALESLSAPYSNIAADAGGLPSILESNAGERYWNVTPPNWVQNPDCCHHQGTIGNDVKGAGPHIWDHNAVAGVGRAAEQPCVHEEVHITEPNSTKIRDALCDKWEDTWIDKWRRCLDHTPRTIFLDFAEADFRDELGEEDVMACRRNVCPDPKQDAWFDDMTQPYDIYCTEPESFVWVKSSPRYPWHVGSNKTVIGRQGGTHIRGKGIWVDYGNSNVIIRNIHFSDINPHFVRDSSDAIAILNASRVVVEHCEFSNLGRYAIRVGPDPATEVAIINNKMSGQQDASPTCNGRHPWFISLNASVQSVALARNHFYYGGGSDDELLEGKVLAIGDPKRTGMKSYVHSFNNWFQDHKFGTNSLAKPVSVYGGPESYFLDEGTYYNNAGRYVDNHGSPAEGVGIAQWPQNEAIVDQLGLQLYNRMLERCDWYPTGTEAYFPNHTEALNAFQQFHTAGKLANRWYGVVDMVKLWTAQFAGPGDHQYLYDYFQTNGQKPPTCPT